MTTIREYARDHHVSYEAIRKQIARYRKDLEGHITTKRQTKYLDDFAVSFLDDRRRENPVVVFNQERSDEVALLKNQVEALKNELLATQKRVMDLQSENQLMIEAKVKYDLLLESSNEKSATIEALREDLKDARRDTDQAREDLKAAKDETDQIRKERDEAQEDARSYQKSMFGLYRKVKR